MSKMTSGVNESKTVCDTKIHFPLCVVGLKRQNPLEMVEIPVHLSQFGTASKTISSLALKMVHWGNAIEDKLTLCPFPVLLLSSPSIAASDLTGARWKTRGRHPYKSNWDLDSGCYLYMLVHSRPGRNWAWSGKRHVRSFTCQKGLRPHNPTWHCPSIFFSDG